MTGPLHHFTLCMGVGLQGWVSGMAKLDNLLGLESKNRGLKLSLQL